MRRQTIKFVISPPKISKAGFTIGLATASSTQDFVVAREQIHNAATKK
jgi:hypothetical protein